MSDLQTTLDQILRSMSSLQSRMDIIEANRAAGTAPPNSAPTAETETDDSDVDIYDDKMSRLDDSWRKS